MLDTLLFLFEIIGVISFAIAGSIVAIDKETDLFGVVFLANITCFGGGIMRDIIIGFEVPRFFTDMTLQFIIATVTSLAVFTLAFIFKKQYLKREKLILYLNNYVDALAIGIFSIVGVQICLDFCPDKGSLLAVLMGMISAVGGGMIRDLILRDIPFILRKRIYALAVLLGGTLYYMLVVYAFPGNEVAEIISRVLSIALVFVLRVLATVFKWNMPKAVKFSEIKENEKEILPEENTAVDVTEPICK